MFFTLHAVAAAVGVDNRTQIICLEVNNIQDMASRDLPAKTLDASGETNVYELDQL